MKGMAFSMVKKIAVIQDLSSFGRCSLTAAISVISAMGVQPCPLPTAILSGQTGYPSYYLDDYTNKMDHFRREWEKMNVHFDGIYTGFMASEAQIAHVISFLDTFYKKDTFLLVDPVMGDNGHPFPFFTPELRHQLTVLAKRADIITPNLTELCLLTNTDYDMLLRTTSTEKLFQHIQHIAQSYIYAKGPSTIVVTGVEHHDIQGNPMMANLAVTTGNCAISSSPYIGESYSGTGDLFASVLAGGIARGDLAKDLIHLASDFISKALTDTVTEKIPRNDGVNYERFLSLLCPDR